MAIEGFKDIVERRGYKVESEDRQIFEREIGKSFFGLGNADMIEFILLDSNDNQLPQGDDGKLVRYIHLNDKNIRDYFLISNNNFTKKKNDASEFIVDIEKLVREAGYENGIFKTQVTLLNRRAGSEVTDIDKLWIHEISPSRTEIRVVPIKKEKLPNKDLEKRYDVLTKKGQFRDDTIYFAKQFIENVTTEKVLKTFSLIKGKQKDNKTYQSLIKKEFKIENIEIFIKILRDKFIESVNYFIDDREWDVSNINYGKPKNKLDVIELSIDTIKQVMEQSITNIISKYLPKRDIQDDNILTPEEQITFDEVKQILKSSVSNTLYDSTEPSDTTVRGCTDPNAKNYNPSAQENDGSCIYNDDPIDIEGCTDSSALNYNPKATKDDGSCKYDNTTPTKTQKFYVWSEKGSIKYKLNSTANLLSGIEFDMFEITYDDDGSIKFSGDVRTTPKLKPIANKLFTYRVINQTEIKRFTGKPIVYDGWNGKRPAGDWLGGGYADDYIGRPYPFDEIDGGTISISKGQTLSFKYKDAVGNTLTSEGVPPGSEYLVCAQENSLILPPGMKFIKLEKCGIEENNNVIVIGAGLPSGGSSGGSGGGGSSFRDEVLFDDGGRDPINPYTNPGDFVDRPVNIRNIK